MQHLKIFALTIVVLTLIAWPSATSSQNQRSPNDFFPPRITRPEQPQGSLVPQTRFKKVSKAIPNRYIVVLKDDVVSDDNPPEVRLERVREIADSHALAHHGRVRYLYETALKGYSIELPNEAAAIAISRSPQVKYVEEDALGSVVTTQFNPPWGLDRIDQESPVLNGQYVFNTTGAGVSAYVIDTGIRSTHVEFGGRASIAADFVGFESCNTPGNNDCHFHGTHVAGTIGGATFGVAKGVTIRSVKVCNAFGQCDTSATIAGVNFVTTEHNATVNRAVANMSLQFPPTQSLDDAVRGSLNAGVSYAVAAGNFNIDANSISPARVSEALTVGASDINDAKADFSDFGALVDLFAPGVDVLSASNASDTGSLFLSGTSMASPHVAGAIALYLQGRTPMTGCGANPKNGPATTSGVSISTCPDRVGQFIASNATLTHLTGLPTDTPNRLLFTGSLPTTTNPIDNQRFFVWTHYPDFLNRSEPDEGGLDHWTQNITGPCGTGVNVNNECTHEWRYHTSRAFFVFQFPSLFNPQTGGTTSNEEFVRQCYRTYLRREPDAEGFQHWVNDLNTLYGNPASYNGVNHLIDAFITSPEYRRRFGQP